jgi:hypothetical protein
MEVVSEDRVDVGQRHPVVRLVDRLGRPTTLEVRDEDVQKDAGTGTMSRPAGSRTRGTGSGSIAAAVIAVHLLRVEDSRNGLRRRPCLRAATAGCWCRPRSALSDPARPYEGCSLAFPSPVAGYKGNGPWSRFRWSGAVSCLVELRGFEPLTPSMPWKCATNCATAPGFPEWDAPNGDCGSLPSTPTHSPNHATQQACLHRPLSACAESGCLLSTTNLCAQTRLNARGG